MKSDTKLLFCGTFISPFIREDLRLLKTYFNNMDVINLDIIQDKREGIFIFLFYLYIRDIKKIIKSDVVYIWFALHPTMILILLAKLFGKRTVVWIGGWEVAKCKEIDYGNQLNKIHGKITRWCLRHADVILVPSNAYKKITLNLEPTANIYIIHQTINDDIYNYDIPKKEKIIVTAAFSLKFTNILKGIPLFEKAAMLTPYKFIVCDGLPHDELMEIFKKSKVYCQFSYTESFGIALVEAMACKCIPVVVDRDALPEIIGDSGIVVPYGDVKAASKAMCDAMCMNGELARERAKLFSSDKRMRLMLKIIDNDIVSVVIPSYNSAKWLPETIQSIKNQSYKNIEIIIVDDCSTDNTKELIESMNDPNIIYVRNSVNKGECRSSRLGFDLASGKYICRLSSDDMYANTDKIKNQVKYMDDTNADWSYNSINCIGETIETSIVSETYWMVLPTRYGHKILQLFDNYVLLFPRIAFLRLFTGNPVNSSTIMLRKTSYMQGDKWSDEHRTDCDGHLLFNLLLRGAKGIAIREMGSFYRKHPTQMSYNPLYIEEMKIIRRNVMKKVYDGKYPLWLKISLKLLERVIK